MLAGPQNYPVDRVLVQLQQDCSGSHTNSLGCVMDDLSDLLGRQMQAKQGAGLGESKSPATGPAVKKIAAFVLAVLTMNCNVALTTQTVILILFIGTEKLLKFAHQLPPVKMNSTAEFITQDATICQIIGDITERCNEYQNHWLSRCI